MESRERGRLPFLDLFSCSKAPLPWRVDEVGRGGSEVQKASGVRQQGPQLLLVLPAGKEMGAYDC
jgi:hypothetical protein